MNTKSFKSGANIGTYIKKCSLSAGIGLAVAVVAVLIFSVLFNSLYKAEQFYDIFTLILYLASAFVAGRCAMKFINSAAALSGALTGLIMTITLFALSFCFSGELIGMGGIFINSLLIVFSSIVGAISFTFKKARRRKIKRK